MSQSRPERPVPLEFDPGAVPETLRDHEQWVAWRYQWDTDRDEWTKVPIDVNTGDFASSTDPDKWASFVDASQYHADSATDTDGIGFVVTDDDLFVGLDLDDCRDPDTGDVEEWARELVDDADTYAEWSPSGTGARAFGVGFMPDGKTRSDVDGADGHIEMYETGRYLTVTGHKVDTAAADVEHFNDEIRDIHKEYIADPPKTDTNGHEEPDSGTPNPGGDTDLSGFTDADLVEKAKNAENGQKFEQLWNGRTSGYESHSEARMAFANMLAFWTGGDEKRMLDIFERSDLYRGDDDTRTWKEYEAPKAVKNQTDFYDPDSGRQSETQEEPDQPTSSDDGGTVDMRPVEVKARAGLGEDGEITDLTDRQKAACVWDLIRQSDEYHVRVRRDNGSIWGYEDGVWTSNGERILRHAGRRALGSMNYGANVLTELKAQAKSDPTNEIFGDTFGVEPGTIAVENGLLSLKDAANGAGTDSLCELEPEHYALTQIEAEYDPEADAEEWRELVDDWTEAGREKMLQEYVGYCLHMNALPIDRALLLVGSGANGKSTFLAVIRALLGRDNTSSIELQTLANEANAVADFYGSVANIDDDLSARKLGNGLGMFKKLTAGDRVQGRQLYEEGFEYDATGKHLYAANEVPQVNVPDDDEAFWRRWIIVEFPNHYPPNDRDPTLRDRLTTDEALSGVLNWAIEGWDRLMEQGHFTNEKTYAAQKRERWQAWGESVDQFISNCVERDEEADRITTSEAYERYAAWCRLHGHDNVGQQQLTNKLKNENVAYGRHRINGRSQRGFKALGISDDVPDPNAVDDADEPDQDTIV